MDHLSQIWTPFKTFVFSFLSVMNLFAKKCKLSVNVPLILSTLFPNDSMSGRNEWICDIYYLPKTERCFILAFHWFISSGSNIAKCTTNVQKSDNNNYLPFITSGSLFIHIKYASVVVYNTRKFYLEKRSIFRFLIPWKILNWNTMR